MTKNFKQELIESFIPQAVLIPLTTEATCSVIETRKSTKFITVDNFPFKVGRESRISKNEKGLFVKLRILNEISSPNNDIYLVNTTNTLEISKEHFQIEKTKDEFFIKDRNSTLGTKLNNLEIGKENSNSLHKLEDGDIIKVGSNNSKYEFKFLILK